MALSPEDCTQRLQGLDVSEQQAIDALKEKQPYIEIFEGWIGDEQAKKLEEQDRELLMQLKGQLAELQQQKLRLENVLQIKIPEKRAELEKFRSSGS